MTVSQLTDHDRAKAARDVAPQAPLPRHHQISAWVSRIGTVAVIALLTGFFGLTVVVGASGQSQDFIAIKRDILFGMAAVVPIILIVGAALGRLAAAAAVDDCVRRIRFAAIIVCAVLVPSAVGLHLLAQAYAFETLFFFVQGVELLFQEFVVALMICNLRGELKAVRRPEKADDTVSTGESVNADGETPSWSRAESSVA